MRAAARVVFALSSPNFVARATVIVAASSLSLFHAAEPDANWLATVQQNLAREEYHFEPGENGGYQAPNRAQGFRVVITEGSVHVAPRLVEAGGTDAPTLTWRTARWGRPQTLEELQHLGAIEKDGSMRLQLGPVVETLTNDARGLEQGLEIAVPPRGPRHDRLVVESELTTNLLAHPSEDGRMIRWLDATGKPVYWLSALSVKDATGAELPARFEVDPRRLAIVIDDAGAVYPLTVDPLLTSPMWTNQTNQTNAHYGVVSTAGDVNGDGFSDILVAAPDYDNGQVDEGRVFLYFGSASGPAIPFSRAFESNQANAHFGSSVSAAGDLNGDGFDDFAIGAVGYDDPQADEGAVFVYVGSATPANIIRATTLEVDQAGAELGYALAYGGDVDGDGSPELVVGAPFWDGGQTDEGAMFLYFGDPTSVIRTTTPFHVESDQAGANLGSSVAGGVDVDSNGFSDVFAGAPNWDTATVQGAGKVIGVYGSAGTLSVGWSVQFGLAASFGWSIAAVGDTDGDGDADVLVGAPNYDGAHTQQGRVMLFRGSSTGLDTSYTRAWDGGPAGAQLGMSVGAAGDVNGDGFADFVAGAPGISPPGLANAGEVRLWLGKTGTIPTAPSWTYTGDQANSGVGSAAFTAGDVNGDGYSDLIIGAGGYDTGAPDGGQAYVFLGSGDGLNTTEQATLNELDPTSHNYYGWVVASAGDVNADGFSDVIVGAPFLHGEDGRAFVYLGSATGISSTANVELAGPSLSDAQLGYAATGVGDVNGDGYDDVAVGAPQFFYDAEHDVYSGQVFVYFGGPAGVDATADFSDPDPPHFGDDQYGRSICPAGDANGDGLADFAVGGRVAAASSTIYGSRTSLTVDPLGPGSPDSCAWGDVNEDGYSDLLLGFKGSLFGSAEGLFEILPGGSAGLSDPSWSVLTTTNDAYDFAGVAIGDVNGDGHLDVVTGNGHDGFNFLSTRISVYLGSATGPDETADQTFLVPRGATSMASAGDVNGDGMSDLIIGSALVDANHQGSAAVHLGSASGLGTTPAFTRDGALSDAQLGTSVAGSLDVNGDGFSDVLISEPNYNPGHIYVHLGGGGDALDYIPRNFRGDNTGPVGLLGWSGSNDRFRILARGRSARGRALVAMDHRVAPVGTPLTLGTLARGGYFDTGTTDPSGADIPFNRLVSGLTTATAYKWAMQFRTKDPIFPHTRWISLPGNGREETDVRTACTLVTWFRDNDGDAYGTAAFSVQACSQPAGYVAASGDCNDAQPAMFPGNPEVCDGLDNDCAGGVDNGFVAPAGAPALSASKTGVTIGLSWPGLGGADRYDVVRGDLGALRSSAGNFTSSTQACVANDSSVPQASDATAPGSGGLWYLARGVNCNANGTYDDPSSSQAGGRNAEIAASPSPCP